MLLILFGNLTQQIMPLFVEQRSLYEARERPSKAYSWVAFLLAQILVEIPWQTLAAVLSFVSWYYPIGLYRNAVVADQVKERGALMFLFILQFMLFTSTVSNLFLSFARLSNYLQTVQSNACGRFGDSRSSRKCRQFAVFADPPLLWCPRCSEHTRVVGE